jgi:hypothetical protein
VVAAERLVALRLEALDLAKLDSLVDAGIPAAGKYDRVAAANRVNAAQRAYDDASDSAASAAGETAAAKGARSTQEDSAGGAPRPPTP